PVSVSGHISPSGRLPNRLLLIAGALFVAFIATTPLVILYTDWLWFQEVALTTVFQKELLVKTLLFGAGGLVAFLFLYLNLRLANRGIAIDPVVIRTTPQGPPMDLMRLARRLTMPATLFVAVIVAFAASSAWMIVLQAMHATPFGVTDPILGRDVGFYVFSLPVLSALLSALNALTVFALILCAGTYWVRGELVLPPPRVRLDPGAGKHLGALIALLLVVTAVQIWTVRVPGLLFSDTGPFTGASYTDIHARLPAHRALAVIAMLGAVWVLVGAARRKLPWHAAVVAGAYFGTWILGDLLYPTALQKLVVAPTELTNETPQLQHHIRATREAWGLDAVEVRDIAGDAGLELADIEANAPTIQNVRLWDREPLLQTFGQLQEIRTYYDFVSVDDDRYLVDGTYRQVMLSPRELNPASLPTRNFINERLTFTHGMGLTLAPVNQVTVEGLPVLFVKDLPPASSVSLTVTRPQIYFGELTGHYVFVGTRQREFDYPSGEDNVFTSYAGRAGVPIRSLMRRSLFAYRFGSKDILLSRDITNESRILFHRSIHERAGRAYPFLDFDADPYLVVNAAGELKWILDAYTTSRLYPYAQRIPGGTNYMRNSVKVVIDAYDGDLQAYISDPDDPIVQTLTRIFPGVLAPLEELPDDLRAHLRYPEDLYRHQVGLHSIYHMTDPQTFYNREDQWQIPSWAGDRSASPFMRRIVMRLPGEPREEFIFMTPFTPRGKDNLAAWMVARSDGEHYGKLAVFRFPKQSLVFGPQQVVNRINQDTEISRQVSLWDQGGSQVIRGELLVIPIEESLLYVQPMYLRAEGGRIPELKRVVVAYQNRVVMEETLEQGLARLFGGQAPRTVLAGGTPGEAPAGGLALPAAGDARFMELLDEIRAVYDRALAAQRAGNWAEYGAEIERLGELIRRAGG
ncbi:MAG: UPF0182 family protein, partial [Gemmatimonadales bacterium]